MTNECGTKEPGFGKGKRFHHVLLQSKILEGVFVYYSEQWINGITTWRTISQCYIWYLQNQDQNLEKHLSTLVAMYKHLNKLTLDKPVLAIDITLRIWNGWSRNTDNINELARTIQNDAPAQRFKIFLASVNTNVTFYLSQRTLHNWLSIRLLQCRTSCLQ